MPQGPRPRYGKQLTLKVPDDVYEWLVEGSLMEDRTLSSQARRVLKDAYERYDAIAKAELKMKAARSGREEN